MFVDSKFSNISCLLLRKGYPKNWPSVFIEWVQSEITERLELKEESQEFEFVGAE